MKLLSVITISLMSTIVSSNQCKNPKLKCIELCCAVTQFYEDTFEYCEHIPKESKASWYNLMHSNMTLEFKEYGQCSDSVDIIPSCYSPYYNISPKQVVLKRWLNVPCYRLDEPVFVWPIGVLVGIGVLPLCLPIMVVYTCRKGLKDNFSYKLVSWYLASMAVALLTDAAAAITHLIPREFLDIVIDFFFVSTCLWLNVIGFQIWSGFRVANAHGSSDRNERRFMYYSIYVWGIAIAITGLDYMVSGGQWNLIVGLGLRRTIAVCNLGAFLILSVNICMIRCRAVKLTSEPHYKRQLVFILCRLCLMMGIPRMLLIISRVFDKTDFLVGYFCSILEPFAIFIVLVLKPKHIFNWICSCRRTSDKVLNAADESYTNTNMTNLPNLKG